MSIESLSPDDLVALEACCLFTDVDEAVLQAADYKSWPTARIGRLRYVMAGLVINAARAARKRG
jgi:hypothetical protein